ncbi:MAG: hypothetical protein K6U00_12425, partial [Armatimonadetes bacterium]|nr:hypothetical protein [Armatimonadota bacterium]
MCRRVLHSKHKGILGAVLLLIISLTLLPSVFAADTGDEEVQLGKAAAEQVAKEAKFVTDETLVKRLEAVGNEIA